MIDAAERHVHNNDAISRPKTLRSFKNNGLRIIFVLLSDPKLVAAPYRALAHLSGASLGTVHGVLAELQTIGYIAGAPSRLPPPARASDHLRAFRPVEPRDPATVPSRVR